jgi:hypothetical protein
MARTYLVSDVLIQSGFVGRSMFGGQLAVARLPEDPLQGFMYIARGNAGRSLVFYNEDLRMVAPLL